MLASVLLSMSLALTLQVGDPAELLPPDTLVYFGTSSLRAGAEASRNTAMARIMGEAEVRSFMHQPTAAAEGVLQASLSEWMDDFGAEAEAMGVDAKAAMDIDLGKLMSSDGELPPVGPIFMGITHLRLQADGPPDVGVVVGAELLDDEMIGMVQNLWSMIPAEEETIEHEGASFLHKAMDESGNGVSMGMLGKLVVIATSQDVMRGVLDRFHGRAEVSLANAPGYREMVDIAGGLGSSGSSSMVRFGAAVGIMRDALAIVAERDEIPAEEVEMISTVLDQIGLEALTMVGGVSRVDRDGNILSTSVGMVDLKAPGFLAEASAMGVELDLDALGVVPADCMSASLFGLGQIPVQTYDFALGILEQVDPDTKKEFDANLAEFMGGVDLRNDLLANLGGQVLSFSVTGQGLMGEQPNSFMTMDVRDGDAFVNAVGTLLQKVGDEFQMPVKLRSGTHEGIPLHEVDISAIPMAGAMAQPAFAIKDGKLIYGSAVAKLKTFLNGSLSDQVLVEDPGFQAFLEDVSEQGTIQSLSYSDNARTFGSLYSQLVGMAQMFAGGMGDIPVDLSKLPAEKTITKHLRPSYQASYEARPGVVVTRAVSQFGMADFMPVLVVGGLVGLGVAEGIEVEPMAEEVDPYEQVQSDLRELKASLTVYKISQDGYPESLAALLAPLPDFPNGAYTGEALPTDPWGNEYRFAMETHPTKKRVLPKLWSVGPNGADESGEGDDIVKL